VFDTARCRRAVDAGYGDGAVLLRDVRAWRFARSRRYRPGERLFHLSGSVSRRRGAAVAVNGADDSGAAQPGRRSEGIRCARARAVPGPGAAHRHVHRAAARVSARRRALCRLAHGDARRRAAEDVDARTAGSNPQLAPAKIVADRKRDVPLAAGAVAGDDVAEIGARDPAENIRGLRFDRDAAADAFADRRQAEDDRRDKAAGESVEPLAEYRHETGAEAHFEPAQGVVIVGAHEAEGVDRALVPHVGKARSV